MTDDLRMFWIDMETTGLDPSSDVPLEVAIGLTDEWGNNLTSKSSLIYEMTTRFAIAVTRGKAHEIVGPMHNKSGLWSDIDHYYGTLTAPSADQSVMPCMAQDTLMVNWLRDHDVQPKQMPLCGNSVGGVDKPFLQVFFPHTFAYLSYRVIDVSTLKETCRRVNPELFERLKPVADTKESASHRALDDLKASITEYQAYLDNFLFTSLGD